MCIYARSSWAGQPPQPRRGWAETLRFRSRSSALPSRAPVVDRAGSAAHLWRGLVEHSVATQCLRTRQASAEARAPCHVTPESCAPLDSNRCTLPRPEALPHMGCPHPWIDLSGRSATRAETAFARDRARHSRPIKASGIQVMDGGHDTVSNAWRTIQRPACVCTHPRLDFKTRHVGTMARLHNIQPSGHLERATRARAIGSARAQVCDPVLPVGLGICAHLRQQNGSTRRVWARPGTLRWSSEPSPTQRPAYRARATRPPA